MRITDAVRQRGFTLVELVVTLVVGGILAVALTDLITKPMDSYIAVERRARLVDTAETALSRMSREVRLALPNSIRVSGTTALEFLRTLDGGRYRAVPDGSDNDACGPPPDTDTLDFAAAVDCFEVLGPLQHVAQAQTGAADQADCMSSPADRDCVVIFNTGQPGANAYAGDNVAGLVQVAGAGVSFSGAPAPWHFPFSSPARRFHIVDTPVSYVCSGGELRRYDGYPIALVQTVPPPAAGRLVATGVSACRFLYVPGTSSRTALVTLEIAVAEAGETVTLLQQVHVPNAP